MDPANKALLYSAYTKLKLHDMVTKVSKYPMRRYDFVMALRKDMQRSLADASQKGSLAGRLPPFAQNELLERIMWLEKMGRRFFFAVRKKELELTDPLMLRIERKRKIRGEWENVVLPKLSY